MNKSNMNPIHEKVTSLRYFLEIIEILLQKLALCSIPFFSNNQMEHHLQTQDLLYRTIEYSEELVVIYNNLLQTEKHAIFSLYKLLKKHGNTISFFSDNENGETFVFIFYPLFFSIMKLLSCLFLSLVVLSAVANRRVYISMKGFDVDGHDIKSTGNKNVCPLPTPAL